MPDGALTYRRSRAWARPSTRTLVTLVVVALTLTLNLVQQPGLITFDTKLDLTFDPVGFLDRSLSLWNGDSAIGGLQNQASGYLFPMGPVFVLGHALGVPMWIWQRLWSAAVMLLAYGGARRLASHWPGINQAGAVLAGLTYMLAPRMLTTVGGLSGESLPGAVLPWTVLPLVLYLRGKLRGRYAFLWSAATIPWMGGQNATLVLACLLFPALLLAFTEGRPWRHRLRDLVVWGCLVVLVTLWWLVPLFLLGGYAPPFLDFIESSANTAKRIGWLASFRGTSHWVAFFPGGGSSGWAGGYALASSPVLLLTTVATAGAGLLGLARSGLWTRRVLVAAVLLGLTVLTLGSGGLAGSVLAAPWREALDTWLAPLRNIHKFDPLVRLPIALGVGSFVTTVIPRLVARSRRVPAARAPAVLLALTAVAALCIGAAAQPAAAGKLRDEGGMNDISAAWRGAVDYLGSQPGPTGVLVLPGSDFATQYWGRTLDEPMQVLGGPPWVARALVTVAPAGTLRMMDAIERMVDEGRPQQGLSAAMRRLGVTHVVVRNDLDPDETDAPSPEVVYASLAGVPDLHSVAEFGKVTKGHPEVEVFALDKTGADPRVTLMDWADRRVVQGGQEVVGDLVADGLVGAGQATVLTSAAPRLQPDIVTDSNRRAERAFGRVHAAISAVMTPNDTFRRDRPLHDFVGDQVPRRTTTAQYDGAVTVTASSSRGYADVLGPVRPFEHPYAAFDDSVFTAWASDPFDPPSGQWIEARFDEPLDPGLVDLQFDTGSGADVRTVRLTTDAGSRTVRVGKDGRAGGIDLPGSTTRAVRMTVVKVAGKGREVRLSDFGMRDHSIRRTLRVPGRVAASTSVHLSSELPRRACLTTENGVRCRQAWQQETPETTGFDRTLDVVQAGSWRIAGTAVATNGAAPERLLAPLSDEQVSVTATSTFAGDPAVAAANALDGRPETSWYASPLDPTPGLQLSWRQKRVITSIRTVLGKDQPGVLPTTLVVDPMTRKDKPQLVDMTGPRAGVMTPVRTNRLRVTVLPQADRPDGIGISELQVAGVEDLRHVVDPDAHTGLRCGFGPTVEIGGRTIQTRVTGRVGDVLTGAELEVRPCGAGAVPVPEGSQRIRVTNPSGFAVSDLWLEPDTPRAAAAPVGTSEVKSWSPTERTVAVHSEQDSVLALAQSSNRGWQAEVGGATLEPVVVDGWRQAWRIPAGTNGDVHLRFAPQGTFRLGIIVGLVIAALLSLAALATWALWWRRRRRTGPARDVATPDSPPLSAGWRRVGLVAGAAILALVSVALALGAVLGFWTRGWSFVALARACAVGLLAASVIAIVGPGTVVVPPEASDVLVALVVGVVAGRVLGRRDEPEGDRA